MSSLLIIKMEIFEEHVLAKVEGQSSKKHFLSSDNWTSWPQSDYCLYLLGNDFCLPILEDISAFLYSFDRIPLLNSSDVPIYLVGHLTNIIFIFCSQFLPSIPPIILLYTFHKRHLLVTVRLTVQRRKISRLPEYSLRWNQFVEASSTW